MSDTDSPVRRAFKLRRLPKKPTEAELEQIAEICVDAIADTHDALSVFVQKFGSPVVLSQLIEAYEVYHLAPEDSPAAVAEKPEEESSDDEVEYADNKPSAEAEDEINHLQRATSAVSKLKRNASTPLISSMAKRGKHDVNKSPIIINTSPLAKRNIDAVVQTALASKKEITPSRTPVKKVKTVIKKK